MMKFIPCTVEKVWIIIGKRADKEMVIIDEETWNIVYK